MRKVPARIDNFEKKLIFLREKDAPFPMLGLFLRAAPKSPVGEHFRTAAVLKTKKVMKIVFLPEITL